MGLIPESKSSNQAHFAKSGLAVDEAAMDSRCETIKTMISTNLVPIQNKYKALLDSLGDSESKTVDELTELINNQKAMLDATINMLNNVVTVLLSMKEAVIQADSTLAQKNKN